MGKLFIENGRIYTMDPAHPVAKNVYIENGIVRSLDINKIDKELLPEDTSRIDLQGRCCLPGFHDSHLHMIAYGMTQNDCVNLSKACSIEKVKELLRKHIKENHKKPGSWVMGAGWNHENFQEKRMPTREDLDQVSTEHYIFIKRVCIHIAAINSRLLELCNISKDTYENNADIGRHADGQPNGLIFEDAINDPVLAQKPPYSVEEIEELIVKTAGEIRSKGFTTIQTDDMKAFPDFQSKINILNAYNNLRRQDRLPLRIIEQLQVSSLKELKEILSIAKDIPEDDYFSFQGVKVLLDGSLGGWTAAVNKSYRDNKKTQGILNFTDEELEEITEYCYKKDLQLACHAIGDRAIDQILRIISRIKEKYHNDLRPRIVHCQLSNYSQIRRMVELNIHADIQPMFVPSDYKLVAERIENENQNTIYAWKTLLNEGVHLSGSSDSPVESYLPFQGIRAAVTRMNLENLPKGGWRPFEKLTVNEALALYTTGAAYSCRKEKTMGKIKEGYLGDFVIVDQDPYEIEETRLHDISVKQIICAGR